MQSNDFLIIIINYLWKQNKIKTKSRTATSPRRSSLLSKVLLEKSPRWYPSLSTLLESFRRASLAKLKTAQLISFISPRPTSSSVTYLGACHEQFSERKKKVTARPLRSIIARADPPQFGPRASPVRWRLIDALRRNFSLDPTRSNPPQTRVSRGLMRARLAGGSDDSRGFFR